MAYRYISTNSFEAGSSTCAYTVPLSPYSSLAGALDHAQDSEEYYFNRHRAELMGAGLMWPTNHLLVPQVPFSEERATPKSYPDMKHSPIIFQLVDFPEVGVRISKIVANDTPRIAGGGDKVLDIGDREIKIWLLWPGYNEPLQKRIKTQSGAITRDTLLLVIAKMILNFAAEKIQSSELPAKPGYESWTISTRPDGLGGLMGPELFITRLIHLGGANWQPELWAPRFN